jgi:sec-independent protein translocase protein TatA
VARRTVMGFDVSAIQILIVLVIALLVFGPKRLPELGKQIGRGIREIKSQMSAVTDDIKDTRDAARVSDIDVEAASVGSAADEPDDDLLDGVVVSGSAGPEPPQRS